MIAGILALAALAAQNPVAATVSPAPPLACQAAEDAMRDQFATMNVRFVPGRPGPGPLGRDYLKVSDRLAKVAREDRPDLARVGTLWRELNCLKLEIAQRVLANKTQCDLERLKLLPSDRQRAYLRGLSPMTQEERENPIALPVPPPSIHPAPPPRTQPPRPVDNQ